MLFGQRLTSILFKVLTIFLVLSNFSCLEMAGVDPLNQGLNNAVQQEGEDKTDLDVSGKPFDLPPTIAKNDDIFDHIIPDSSAESVDATKLAIISDNSPEISHLEDTRKWYEFRYSHATNVMPRFKLIGVKDAAPPNLGILVQDQSGNKSRGTSDSDGSFRIVLHQDMVGRMLEISIVDADQTDEEAIPSLRAYVTMDGKYSFKITSPEENIAFKDIAVYGNYVIYNEKVSPGKVKYKVMSLRGGKTMIFSGGPTTLRQMQFYPPRVKRKVPAKIIGITDDANLGMALPMAKFEDHFRILNDYKNGDIDPDTGIERNFDFAIHAPNPSGKFSLYSPNLEGARAAAMILVPLIENQKDVLIKDSMSRLATRRWVDWSSKDVLWALNEITHSKGVVDNDVMETASDYEAETDGLVDEDLDLIVDIDETNTNFERRYVVNRYNLSSITELGIGQITNFVEEVGPVLDANQQRMMITKRKCRKLDVTELAFAKENHYVMECLDDNDVWQAVLGSINDAVILSKSPVNVSGCKFNKTGELLACSFKLSNMRWGIRLFFLPTEKVAWLVPPESFKTSSMFSPKFSMGKDPYVLTFLEQFRSGASVNVINLRHHPFFRADIKEYKDQPHFSTGHYFESGRYESIAIKNPGFPIVTPSE